MSVPAGVADLAAAVESSDPSALLPALRAGEERRLAPPLTVVASQLLGDGAAVAVVQDSGGTLLGVPLAWAGEGWRRAVPGDGVAAELVDALARAPADEALRFVALDGVSSGPGAERSVGVDQTHDSVVVDQAVVKWTVFAERYGGDPPALATARRLASAGFTETPTSHGFLLADVGESTVQVAAVSAYLAGAQDGWDWYVDDLTAAVAGAVPAVAPADSADAIGGLVARMHVALAQPFRGEASVHDAGASAVAGWSKAASAQLGAALASTTGDVHERLRRHADVARDVLRSLDHLDRTPVMPVHGDLHVGQVLRWPGGLAVSDFDGNPVVPPAERSAPQPAARDVAGMARALDHVGRVVDRRSDGRHHDAVVAEIARMRRAFLAAYADELAAHDSTAVYDERLLAAFEVEQECREFVYAARHLPRWTYVPDAAFAALMSGPGD